MVKTEKGKKRRGMDDTTNLASKHLMDGNHSMDIHPHVHPPGNCAYFAWVDVVKSGRPNPDKSNGIVSLDKC